MKPKKIPMRMCVGCRESKPKRELIRVVRAPDGTVSMDPGGKKPGRGAYVCRQESCLMRAIRQKQLERQLEVQLTDDVAEALRQELAGKLLAGKTLDPNGLRDELLHSIACKSAIKAGWQTSDEELRRLVQEVLTRDDIKYCPHGRPVCVTLTKRQLEKQFKRV